MKKQYNHYGFGSITLTLIGLLSGFFYWLYPKSPQIIETLHTHEIVEKQYYIEEKKQTPSSFNGKTKKPETVISETVITPPANPFTVSPITEDSSQDSRDSKKPLDFSVTPKPNR